VDHPYLVIHSDARSGLGEQPAAAPATRAASAGEAKVGEGDEEECGICHEVAENAIRAECGCAFCR